MFVQYGGRCNQWPSPDWPGEPTRGHKPGQGIPIRVVRISKDRKTIWYKSGCAKVKHPLDCVSFTWPIRGDEQMNTTEVIEHVRWDEPTRHYWPQCSAVDVVPLRRRHRLGLSAPQRQYRTAVVRNWFKVWCAFKLLALAQRARKRANEPGGCGARAAQANFERAAKRQRL